MFFLFFIRFKLNKDTKDSLELNIFKKSKKIKEEEEGEEEGEEDFQFDQNENSIEINSKSQSKDETASEGITGLTNEAPDKE